MYPLSSPSFCLIIYTINLHLQTIICISTTLFFVYVLFDVHMLRGIQQSKISSSCQLWWFGIILHGSSIFYCIHIKMMTVRFIHIFIYTNVSTVVFIFLFFCNISLLHIKEITITSIKNPICLLLFLIVLLHFNIHIILLRLVIAWFLDLTLNQILNLVIHFL